MHKKFEKDAAQSSSYICNVVMWSIVDSLPEHSVRGTGLRECLPSMPLTLCSQLSWESSRP